MEDLTPADWFGVLELPGIFTESMCPTIRAPGDELPWEEGIISDGTRYKYIHTVGAVGQVQWVDRGGHSYSGLVEFLQKRLHQPYRTRRSRPGPVGNKVLRGDQ